MNETTQTQNRPVRMPEQRERERGFITPPANIFAGENEYLIELEMPGVNKDHIEITIDGNELTIIGRRQSELPEGELYYYESPLADYRRAFELGPDVDTSKISAQMDQGLLKLRLPKSEKSKPRKIQIAG